MKFLMLLIIGVLSMPALAQEKGDWILRAGPIVVDPDTDSDVIDVAGIVALPGVEVDDDTQLGITATYMLTSKFGLGLLAATPFTHDIVLKDLGVKAGSTKQLPPTLMLQYFPGGDAAVWYTDIDSEAKIKTAIANVKFDVELDPFVYILSVGYKF